jgi:hypothetical protein
MAATPEIEPKSPVPEGVVERPAEIPRAIERGAPGVQRKPVHFKAQVTDDQGQPLIQTPQAKAITIQLPTTQSQLDDWAKGSAENSITWYALFWLRMIKKALHFGWKTVSKAATGVAQTVVPTQQAQPIQQSQNNGASNPSDINDANQPGT